MSMDDSFKSDFPVLQLSLFTDASTCVSQNIDAEGILSADLQKKHSCVMTSLILVPFICLVCFVFLMKML